MKKILVAEDDRATRLLVSQLLRGAGFSVTAVSNGAIALKRVESGSFDLVVTDVWMPRMNGLELLAHLKNRGANLRAIVMTSDDTPATLLRSVREQAWHYLTKPVEAAALLELVQEAVSAAPVPPIEVVSSAPGWVELLVPCDIHTANRVQSFMARLDSGLSEEMRERVGYAFRELLCNAVEWGGGLDPNRKVRIACLRTPRLLMYRIADPGPGFRLEDLPHAAVSNEPDAPYAHLAVRAEKGLRPGGFGLLMTKTLVDELIYNERRNEVVFIKYLEHAAGAEK